jgi:hypothetical protein
MSIRTNSINDLTNVTSKVSAAAPDAAHADDAPDHGETVLRVQGLLGITQTGWVSPDVIALRIEQLKKAAHAQQDAAPAVDLASLLPEGAWWGDALTMATLREIIARYEQQRAAASPSDATGKS